MLRSSAARANVANRANRINGWSLIELLAAGTLFVVALLAAAPLFIRSRRDLAEGAARSFAGALAQDHLEALLPAAPPGAPLAGSQYLVPDVDEWITAPAPPLEARWQRETTVQLFSLSALGDGRLEEDESLPPEELDAEPHLVSVRVEAARPGSTRRTAVLERIEWLDP